MSRVRLIVLCVLCILLLSTGTLYWWISSHGFSAREKPSSFEALVARNVRRLATPPSGRAMLNPVSRSSSTWMLRCRALDCPRNCVSERSCEAIWDAELGKGSSKRS